MKLLGIDGKSFLKNLILYGSEMVVLSMSLARVQYTVLTSPNKDTYICSATQIS